ncbi:MAG: hypothetical protein MUP14_07755 [Dehalococcoidia bacterium]|nr:hypothetical protein [Dehalococcoidia bacterium]
MTTRAISLGKDFDIVWCTGGDFVVGPLTGNRICMKNYSHVTFVLASLAGNGTTDDVTVDLQQYTAYTGGTTADLDIVTTYYIRGETTLDGNEDWTKTTQTEASEITAIAGTQELQNLLIIEVHRDQLSDGYTHIGLNALDFGSTDVKYGVIIAICHLLTPRDPQILPYALTGANP